MQEQTIDGPFFCSTMFHFVVITVFLYYFLEKHCAGDEYKKRSTSYKEVTAEKPDEAAEMAVNWWVNC